MKAVTLYRPRDFGLRNFSLRDFSPSDFGSGILENALSDFDRYLGSFFGDDVLSPTDRIFNRLPSVDVRETEKAYVLEAELPGFDEKDIEIRLDGNKLSIESKKTEEKKDEPTAQADGSYLRRERRVSSFSRSFVLPENADGESISASFKKGILNLEIGKKAEAQARVIQITR